MLLALLAFLLAAAAPVAESGPLQLCPTAEIGPDCRPVALDGLRPGDREIFLSRIVTINPAALPLERPSMVRIVAMASTEIRWNGQVIGRNGMPGPDAASEEPGRFVANILIPAASVRPGANLLSVRLSAQHLWLPVERPIHFIEVMPYEGDRLPGLDIYLPALLMLGAFGAAFVYFAAAGWSERGARLPLLLTLIAGAALLELAAEVSRSFVAYPYPWHLARVAIIALLAAIIATLAACYAATRLAPGRTRLIAGLTGAAALAAISLVPWYDLKALAAILAGAIGVGIAGAIGLRRGLRGGWAAIAVALAIVLPMAWFLADFLDHAWFVLMAVILVALIAEQVRSLRLARSERDAETQRAAALAERLVRAEREGEPILALKDGARTHRVVESDILYLRAADDYAEAVLADGRVLLVTMTLARLLETLPARFIRVHKSYAVNCGRVSGLAPRPGGGRQLLLSDGSEVPVGRAYAGSVAEAFS